MRAYYKAGGKVRKRNYRKEYDEYHSKPKQRKNRSSRTMARRKAIEEGKVSKGDQRDIDHKDGNPTNNSPSNLRVASRKNNRGWRKGKSGY